ncbi:hypothetical protein POM88_044816 [Heracleum sosnowskyi]|uniref:FRIGIDA-like protein n=1 Tax=Heracleum sosnowskyi TaxID=360622 RepID=A0AAD8H687_9APIA|nr:hypothetical protein POM88_044816 [Heracleum sosnowskyi]
MDSIEKLNCALKLTETKKEHVEKAMLSLLVEWKNLDGYLDSSTQLLLQDCFTDIQSRESRLNELKQSVTTSNQLLNEIRNSLENRMDQVERKEKDFLMFNEEKFEELASEERRVDEKRVEVEGVFDKFCAEKRELEGIRDLIEERFEVFKLKEKSIENREVKLEVIRLNLVEREKELVMMRDLIDMKRKEVESMEENFVSQEKEIDMVKKITQDLCKEFNSQKDKLDKEKKDVDERVREIEVKEKCLKEWVETIDKREKEIDAKNVLSEETIRGVQIKEKNIEDRLKVIELKEKRLKESVEAMNLKKKEFEMKNVSSDERCRGVEIREKKLQDQLKEFELKEKHFREWVGSMDVKEKKAELKNVASEERCRKLQVREKKLDERIKEFESKEKHFRERAKTIEMKKKEVESGRFLNEEKCKTLDLMEKNLQKLLDEFKLKEQEFADRLKSFEDKEKEVNSIRMSCEERCRNFVLEKEKEFELKEKHFKEWVKTIDLKEKEIDSMWILNEERCKKLDSMEKNLQELLIGLKLREQHENRVKSIDPKEKEVDSIRITCEERCKKFQSDKKRLEDQMKEVEEKKKQFRNVDHSIVKPEPFSVDASYADIRFSITMGGKNLLLYLINHKRDLDSMTDEVFRALRMSMNPGKLVLDAMQDFYLIIEDKELEGDVVCKSSILLFEQLRRISPQIPPRLKKAATELAHKWKNKMKSSGEVTIFLNLLASYGLGSAFDPEEFLSLFEVICQHVQISELCQLLDDTDKINLFEVMLKKQQHVKAVTFVCAFGLRDKFQPASLLKDMLKNAEERSNTLRENSNYPVDKMDEAIDNIVASLREALVCISYHKLESEYSPECMGRFIKQLIQQKEDEKVRLSTSNNDAAKQEAEKYCKSATVVSDPAKNRITRLKANDPSLCYRNALAIILSNMDVISLRVFLNENSEDHELLGYDIFNVLTLSKEPAKFVLHAIQEYDPPLLEMRDEDYKSPVITRSCILLLEQLMKQSPEIDPHVKEDAMKLACDWRAKMRTPLQVLGFLQLISTYGLNSSFETSELERCFESVSCINHAPELCQVFRSSYKGQNQTTTLSICHWHQKNTSGLEINKNKLSNSVNFAKLVLDAIQRCYYSNRKRNLNAVVKESFKILLEFLLKMSPQIQPHVEKKAAKFAVDWKAQLLDNGSKKPEEVYALFNLLAVYKVASAVDSNELLGLLDSIYPRRTVPELVRLLGLSHKISDFVESLIRKGDRPQAIRYIYEFDLVGKFPPVPILKNHLNSKKVTETSHIPKGNKVIRRQLAALREVVKCIKDHQLEVEYPPENLLAQVQQLEEQAKEVSEERSQSYKKFTEKQHAASGPEAQTHKFGKKLHAASGPEAQTRKKSKRKRRAAGLDPGPEAQTQGHVSKHPRMDQPAGTPLNVSSPAFSSMTNFAHCEGAYMQHATEAQMQWHIGRHPQIQQVGTFLNVPSPASHSMTNFHQLPLVVNPQNALYG